MVVNLAGAPISARWTDAYKTVLYHSRIDTTRAVVSAMAMTAVKPQLFISTIYPQAGVHDENDTQFGDDFLARLCIEWEANANEAIPLGIRTVIFRFGIVLGKGGGLLTKMLPAFKLGIGGGIGDGTQPFSWIHLEDLGRAFMLAWEETQMQGAYNLTAPYPVTNRELTRTLGRLLHRPTLIPLPRWVLKLIYSEGASVIAGGQHVVPTRLMGHGFAFRYPTLEHALAASL